MKPVYDAIDALPPLRDVIRDHGLRAEKKLGQNFLLDLNLTDKIARQAGDLTGCHAIEIGPGPGGLTRALLKSTADHVTSIEFDPRAIAALSSLEKAGSGRFSLVQGDALAQNLLHLVPQQKRVVVANLPYNIATPLLTGWLAQIRADQGAYVRLVLMFQKEVADRITATVGQKAYGRLGILCQWLCQVKKCFDLPPSAFTPPPKVTSSVVAFAPRPLPDDAPDFAAVERVTALAFQQRRKMIRTSLKPYAAAIDALGLDPSKRAEDLTVEEYIALARFDI